MSFPQLTSIDFLAVDLKDSLVSADVNHTDNNVLPSLDLSRITGLKIFGDSNLSPITHDDLITISRTTTSLQENPHHQFHLYHHQRPSRISLGITHIAKAPRIQTLLRLGLPTAFLRRISPTNPHFCTLVSMSQIRRPSYYSPDGLSGAVLGPSPSTRLFVYASPEVAYVVPPPSTATSQSLLSFWSVRELLAKMKQGLGVEISVGKFLFDTKTRLVHGNYKSAKTVSEMGWGPLEHVPLKGRYGATGLYGDDDIEEEWSAISEEEFWEGVRRGFVKFD